MHERGVAAAWGSFQKTTQVERQKMARQREKAKGVSEGVLAQIANKRKTKSAKGTADEKEGLVSIRSHPNSASLWRDESLCGVRSAALLCSIRVP